MLHRRWQQAKGGDGLRRAGLRRAGIGKSRIAQTLFERLDSEPYTRLRLFCSPHHQDHALYPAITQLEQAAGFRRDDTIEQRLDKLETVLDAGRRRSRRGGAAPGRAVVAARSGSAIRRSPGRRRSRRKRPCWRWWHRWKGWRRGSRC